MPFPAKAVANEFLKKSKQLGGISPFKIQKLVYFAHGWHLAIYGERLINESVEAWQHGPVIPSLYHEFKEWGRDPIRRLALDYLGHEEFSAPLIPHSCEKAHSIIEQVSELYGNLSADQLYTLSHLKGGPWDLAYEEGIRGKDIPDELIKEHFKKLYEDNRETNGAA